jgi:hypothetical protein
MRNDAERRQALDIRLAEAVLDVFRDAAPQSETGLARFKQSSWERSYHWLDASGMALYLLDRITKMGSEGTIPPEVLLRLRQNQRDNRARTEQLFRNFVEVNKEFQLAEIRYVNLKGITLVPGYCANPELRFQVDLDFLVDSRDAERSKEILCSLGYQLTGVNARSWEFKAGGDEMPALRDMYKPKLQRSVEVHFSADVRQSNGVDDPLSRAQSQVWQGFTFPALCESDKFLAQASHLFRHLRSEWTRLAWVLEYRNYIHARCRDDTFWREVRERTAEDEAAAIAIGMASRIATKAFGDYEVPALDSWSSKVLPERFNLWIETYSKEVLLADFPGSKLYLLLDEGSNPQRILDATRLKKLLPHRLPPRIVHASATAPLRVKWNGRREEVKYFLFRLRFHIATGLHYLLEAPRWRRAVVNSKR